MLERLQDLVRKHNGGEPKPLQLTEIGWPTHRGGVPLRDQARYAVRAFVMALSVGVERAYWYNLVSSGPDPAKREHNFGLVRHPDSPRGAYTPKPAYVALAVLARQLSGARFVGRERTPDPVYSYLFERGGEELRVMWTAKRGERQAGADGLELTGDGPLAVTDTYGKTRPLGPRGGQLSPVLSADPVYVTGRAVLTGSAEGVLGRLRRLFG